MNLVEKFEKAQMTKQMEGKAEVPSFKAGDTVRVNYKITEGKTTRIQGFEGVVIRRRNGMKYNATFTVRKMSGSIGVERTFPLYSPLVEEIKLVKKGVVRRGKIYYLRNLRGKAARIKEKLDFTKKEKVVAPKEVKAEVKKEVTEEAK